MDDCQRVYMYHTVDCLLLCVFVFLCVCLCVCVSVRNVCVRARMGVCVSMSVCKCAYVCICACLCAFVSVVFLHASCCNSTDAESNCRGCAHVCPINLNARVNECACVSKCVCVIVNIQQAAALTLIQVATYTCTIFRAHTAAA